ncbi:MAG: aldehyde ferredoxin oxidoreductase family protein [Anaerolineae bacterium]
MASTGFVNLTTGSVVVQETDPTLLRTWLGGRGLGAALLFEHVRPDVAPFDPENCLIFTTGAFHGTAWPTSSRYTVTFKSPATDAYGYANAGGHFAPELRRAGFDAVVIAGRAEQPSVLRVTDGAIEIVPMPDLWGLATSETEARLHAMGDGRVACIGPAGERLVRLAAIMNDGRAAARGGPGAVMGSKNLKAVHVIAGRPLNRPPAGFGPLAKSYAQTLIKHPRSQMLQNETTLLLVQAKQAVGDLPANNHQLCQAPYADQVDARAFSRYWVKRKGCASCPVRCTRVAELEDADGRIAVEGPEFESANAFGPMCGSADPEVAIRANYLCNELGLDTISVGVTIAFAMECHQRGLLDDARFSLDWGDAETILGLMQAIGYREGLGDLLAEGTQRAARRIGRGAERYAMHVKGLELPRQEPRVSKAMALGLATSNRGADHLYALNVLAEIGAWDDVANQRIGESTNRRMANGESANGEWRISEWRMANRRMANRRIGGRKTRRNMQYAVRSISMQYATPNTTQEFTQQ